MTDDEFDPEPPLEPHDEPAGESAGEPAEPTGEAPEPDPAAAERGRKLLAAVEQLLDENESIRRVVAGLRADELNAGGPREVGQLRRAVAEKVVNHYSNRTAASGAITALPAMVPGLGTALAIAGGALADMALLLKYEVEMALALADLFGFDIDIAEERRRVFLLASVSLDSATNKTFPLIEAQLDAIWNYAPRQVTRLLMLSMARLAAVTLGRGMLRALPLVGMAVGAGVNKVLTRQVGEQLVEELSKRRRAVDEEGDDVIDAVIAEEQ